MSIVEIHDFTINLWFGQPNNKNFVTLVICCGEFQFSKLEMCQLMHRFYYFPVGEDKVEFIASFDSSLD